ncbi:MAG: Ni/Fe hydrogenase subunit alpha [Thermoplasmata archaeon HGW-Thermoplasmata-1]|nr:MAG: Ni/Fe hydrogenase subunit alpha [Thermoplasmata archaeon HGW-Thermoplasmata-1]
MNGKVSTDRTVSVHHLTRVEGHGNIHLDAKNGEIKRLEWEVPEAPRFFEAMLKGQHYSDVAHISSRICGICSIGHTLTSLKATESAFGIPVSEQTTALRRLAINGENMQSHVLHIGYLAAPDFFGVGSVFPLIGSKHNDTVIKIIKLHRLANEMSDLVCGRTVHPINMVPGGFTEYPSRKKLEDLLLRLPDAQDTLKEIAAAIKEISGAILDFSRETEYVALSTKGDYALYDGELTSSDTGVHDGDYLDFVEEYFVPQSTAKYSRHARESLMVGALARFNINGNSLNAAGMKMANFMDLKLPCHNPFMNTVAQMAEVAHNIEDCIVQVRTLLEKGVERETLPRIIPKAGRGVGVVEVPRGILIHDYTYDDVGRCKKANLIIPTNQNHGNIQKDMESLVPTILDRPEKEIELLLEMLVRAYDPCISCSTHYLDVRFV